MYTMSYSERFIPVQKSGDLARVQALERKTTSQVVESIFYILNCLSDGKPLNLNLADLVRGYDQTLLHGQEHPDVEVTLGLLGYITGRISPLFLQQGHLTVSLSDDPLFFESPDLPFKRTKPLKRQRWHAKKWFSWPKNPGQPDVVYQVRPSQEGHCTDAFEIIGSLATVEFLREEVGFWLSSGDYSESELSQLLEGLGKLSGGNTWSKERLVEWTRGKIELVSYDKAPLYQEHKPWHRPPVERTASGRFFKSVALAIEQRDLPEPGAVIYANDFSVLLTIGAYTLLNEKDNAITQDSWYEYLLELEEFERILDEVKDTIPKNIEPDLKEAVKRFAAMQFVSKYGGDNPLVLSLKQKLENYDFSQYGYHRLIEAQDSPVSDPADLVEVSKLPSKVKTLLGITGAKNAFESVIIMPYPLGDLQSGLLQAQDLFFPGTEIGFVGKVGYRRDEESNGIEIGSLVNPTGVQTPYGEILEVSPKSQALVEHTGSFLSVPAVTLQAFSDLKDQEEGQEKSVFLDMEAYLLFEYLSIRQELERAHTAYYVSDITQQARESAKCTQESISQSMGSRGSAPVFLAMVNVFRSLYSSN